MICLVPALIIYCEGKTEELYFSILCQRIFRIPAYVTIDIFGEKGQHKALIERLAEERKRYALENEIDEDEIECWAVCDDDNMPTSYANLCRYAEEQNINLAFSRPQFESYLLQHFEQSKAKSKEDLFSALSKHRSLIDGGCCNEGTKGNLDWLERKLMDEPKLIDNAIINANQRDKQTGSPFLTVQNLTIRLRSLEKK